MIKRVIRRTLPDAPWTVMMLAGLALGSLLAQVFFSAAGAWFMRCIYNIRPNRSSEMV
jgi:uncharacterized membrane protein SirB2